MKTFRIKLAIVGIFIFLLPLMVLGQSFLLQDLPTDKKKLGFRYLRPDFKGDDGLSFLSGVYDFSVSIPVGSNMNFEASLPFVTIGSSGCNGGTCNDTESSIGNIYIGVRHRLKSTAEKGTSIALGVFLPTTPEDKFSTVMMGWYADYYEFQKFFPNTLTIYGNVSHHLIKENGLMFNMEIGPNLSIPSGDNDGETELFAHYGLSAGYRTHGIVFKVELAGLAIVTEEAEHFGDRFTHFLVFGVQWNRGSIRPGLFYKLYLNEGWRESLNGVFGIKLDVILDKENK